MQSKYMEQGSNQEKCSRSILCPKALRNNQEPKNFAMGLVEGHTIKIWKKHRDLRDELTTHSALWDAFSLSQQSQVK